MAAIFLLALAGLQKEKPEQENANPPHLIGYPAPHGRSPYDSNGEFHEEWTYERERVRER
jgi:hypothetical protein